jgi:hypothetical protein
VGNTVIASLPLRKIDAPKAAPKTVPSAPVFGLEDWLKTGGWVQQTNMIVHRGGDYVVAPMDVSQGTLKFTAVLVKGKRVEWVLGFHDDKNYYYYQLDDKNLIRYQVTRGSKSPQVKTPHGLDRKAPMSVTMTITPQSISMSVLRGGQWVTLDTWDLLSSPLHGKFGFHIPGSDEIGLQDFRLAAN